jgi:hypothetical protein
MRLDDTWDVAMRIPLRHTAFNASPPLSQTCVEITPE